MKVLSVIAIMILMSACCTKQACICDQLILTFKIDKTQYTEEEIEAFMMVEADREFKEVTSFRAFFDNYSSSFDLFPRMHSGLERVEDYDWILKNDLTGQRDTISNIKYVARDSVFECNQCFLKKDVTHCTKFDSKELIHNGKTINSYTIIISR